MKKRSTTYRLNKVDYSIFIICSLAAVFMLYLFYRDLNSYTIKQSEEPIARIYFKRNTAQRKFLDNDIWEVLTDNSDIYDGDRIRTSKDSEAYTEFLDTGVQIQLGEKSMVQIFKNKKQRSVDFIGGEIFVANTSPEEKVVVRSGKKEIAIAQTSEVKIVLPEVSEAVASGEETMEKDEETTIVVEVMSGQVEITEAPVEKTKNEKVEAEPVVISAGQTLTLVPEVVTVPPVVEEPEIEAEIETEIEEDLEEELDLEVEEEIEDEEELEIEEEVPVPAPAPVVIPTPVIVNVQVEEEEIPPEPIVAGVEKTVSKPAVAFNKSVYDRVNKKYNYSNGFNLSAISDENKSIPAGAVLEVTMKGTSNNDISRWAIQISTGEEEWHQAHPFKSSFGNDGLGIKANVPFTYKAIYVLDKAIVNTNSSWVNICYDPEVLDKVAVIRDLEVTAKILSLDGGGEIQKVQSGFTKTLEWKSLTLPSWQWGNKANDYDYRIFLDTTDIFGVLKSIPVGTRIRITISGSCDRDIRGLRPEIEEYHTNNWIHLFLDEKNDYDALKINNGKVTLQNHDFSFTKIYTITSDFPDTSYGNFNFVVDNENNRKNPTFTDLKIIIEVL